MSKLIPALVFLFVFSLTGCGKESFSIRPDEENDVTGEYSGNLPCADCEKIAYHLKLKPDMTYQESMHYSGKSAPPFDRQGTYTINSEGLIILDKKDQAFRMVFFKHHPKGLVMLDAEGKEIAGNMADLYVLGRKQHNELSEKQRSDFYGRGNEPSWHIDMDFDKSFHFTAMGTFDISVPAVQPSSSQNTLSDHYQVTTNRTELTVTITEQPCRDTLSGDIFYHLVEVTMKPTESQDAQKFSGCGNYLPDPRVYGSWQFTAINETPLAADAYMKGLPRLTLSAENDRLSGHDGCNRLMGGFSIKKNTISFKKMASTMMACPHKDNAVNIQPIIADQTFEYSIEDGNLLLKKQHKTLVTLSPVSSSD